MNIRTRLALALAVSVMLAGGLALLVNMVAFQHAPYKTWWEYSGELLAELEVSRETVERRVGEDPSILFGTPGDTRTPNGVSIDEASRAAQERTIEQAVARSRLLTSVAIGLVTVGALAVGWLLARRILIPVRRMTERARTASGVDPGRPIALCGPNDEIKLLADTFDEMLERTARSHDAQRRFASQVSHELRTPLATLASEVGMLLADAEDPELRLRLGSVADATRRAERLVAQLLVLSRTELDDLSRSTFALDDLIGNVLGRAVEAPEWESLRLEFDLARIDVEGDRALLETLVRNLFENAARHNRSGGWVRVALGPGPSATAVLEVSNSALGRFGAPGTGLSIVEAVVAAHRGTVEWARGKGQVTARVTLPAVASARASAPGEPELTLR